ncbi:MAG: methyltransferase domain-containing protein [Candidatus Eisenbacteria bacterium]
MREALLDLLLCPYCGGNNLRVETRVSGSTEIREGNVVCGKCEQARPVRGGIVDLLLDSLLAETYQPRKGKTGGECEGPGCADGGNEPGVRVGATSDRVSKRCDLDRGWVESTTTDLDSCFPLLGLVRGMKVLEIGAGTCWATSKFAEAGCECVATDILVSKKLECADYWFKEEALYFERVLCPMERLYFKDGVFDMVFTCSALMYAGDLPQVLREIHRVLRPSGRLAICAEPVVGVTALAARRRWKLEDSGNLYTLIQWKRALRSAHFTEVEVLFPHSVSRKLADPSRISNRRSLHFWGARVLSPLWKIERFRSLMTRDLVEFWLLVTPVASPFIAVARR